MTSTDSGFAASWQHALRRLLLVVAVVLVAASASPASRAGNLLEGLAPSRVFAVTDVATLTDGVVAFEGQEWDSTLAALFRSDRSFVEFDLGESTEIHAAFLQGDNNDQYVLTISENGSTFVPLWTVPTEGPPGLRDRWSVSLSGKGRWVRLGVQGGDPDRSVSELQIFAQTPAVMPPPAMRRALTESRPLHVRTSLLYLICAFGAFLFLMSARANRLVFLVAILSPIAASIVAFDAIALAWPLAGREVSLIRAAAASIALLAAIRAAVPGGRWPPHRSASTFALSTSAVMAFAAFYNVGRPQFFDHARNRPEFVHTYDMRVYQPFAKYFEELQYDGIYEASALAYAEDHEGGSLESLGRVSMRGLHDQRIQPISEIANDIRAIRTRFTAYRWAELKLDMRYFEDVMGPEFLSSLTDHGANATPVWVFFARILLAHAPASEGLLTFTGLVDGGLLVLMALALWRAFGLWPMLLAITVFGATDLYMFGTDWTGATLRHDWLALLGFGASALKEKRWTTAGVLLGLAAMIRAFPVVALLGVALPAAWTVRDAWRTSRRMPRWSTVAQENPGTVRVLLSAAACMTCTFLLTGLLYSFTSWVNWWRKVTLLNREGSVNEVSLRALALGGSGSASALHARFAIYVAAQLASVACIAFAVRRRPPHQAMLMAMPLVWVFFNPSNYYSHFVFLFALLASTDDGAAHGSREGPQGGALLARFVPLSVPFLRVAFPLLSLCVAGYWVSLDQDEGRHFQDSTALLFVTIAWLYTNLLQADSRTASATITVL
jgi:hypothetical protein